MRKLRDGLGDSAGAPRFIETLPRHGYRFPASVTVPAAHPAPASEPAAARESVPAVITPPRARAVEQRTPYGPRPRKLPSGAGPGSTLLIVYAPDEVIQSNWVSCGDVVMSAPPSADKVFNNPPMSGHFGAVNERRYDASDTCLWRPLQARRT